MWPRRWTVAGIAIALVFAFFSGAIQKGGEMTMDAITHWWLAKPSTVETAIGKIATNDYGTYADYGNYGPQGFDARGSGDDGGDYLGGCCTLLPKSAKRKH
jgi:hypothetical protein